MFPKISPNLTLQNSENLQKSPNFQLIHHDSPVPKAPNLWILPEIGAPPRPLMPTPKGHDWWFREPVAAEKSKSIGKHVCFPMSQK